ncbi:hypothetical protein EIP86_011356 [Pleurotus ostreatoroseus]|nr:hypothetical protein EIP86_011356 [Pleurotus ostreatoroseus]
MFNLSAIVGSAILYGDFKRATFHQIVTFLYGCGATFAGVFVIAWAPNHTGEGDEGAKSAQAGNDVEAGTSATPSEALSPNVGSLSRRNRATLVIPEPIIGSNASSPVLRNRRSLVSLVGLSPAQSEFVRPLPRDFGDEVSRGTFRRRTLSATTGDNHNAVNRARRPGRQTISAVTSRETSRTREPDSTGQSPRRLH